MVTSNDKENYNLGKKKTKNKAKNPQQANKQKQTTEEIKPHVEYDSSVKKKPSAPGVFYLMSHLGHTLSGL